jgi:hypothetical protein
MQGFYQHLYQRFAKQWVVGSQWPVWSPIGYHESRRVFQPAFEAGSANPFPLIG